MANVAQSESVRRPAAARADDVRGDVEVRRQALAGGRNRRVAALLDEVWCRDGAADSVAPGGLLGEYFCTCGRPDCDEILVLTLDEYRFVCDAPFRFLVAPGHATEVDEVVLRTGEYDVVEIAGRYRHLVDPSP